MRERRCIVTGEVLPEEALIRFVADPDGCVVPDIAATLPGRGIWVSAQREVLETAVAKNQFSRAAKAPLTAPADLADRVERQLVRRLLDDLGLARRAGLLVLGFDNVSRALDSRSAARSAGRSGGRCRGWPAQARGNGRRAGLRPHGRGLSDGCGIELGPRAGECGTCSPQSGAAIGTGETRSGAAERISARIRVYWAIKDRVGRSDSCPDKGRE